MSNPAVTIVVPTYHRVQYLERMINSVCAQTFEDWELLIVDGKSDDGTAELVNGFKPRLGDRLVFIEQVNQGCCVARNTGIAAARGQYVAFLDSDDEFRPTKLERQMELFRLRPDLGLVYCDYSFIDLQGRHHRSFFEEVAPVARQAPYEEVGPDLKVCGPDLFDYLIQRYFIATIVGVVRREVLGHDIRYLDHNMYCCEWMFYLEIVRRCRAGYVDEPLCLHHFVEGSISRTSAIRNSVYHRSLLRIMRRRFADCSAPAMREMHRQLGNTCRQLGFHSYKHSEYGPAARYFAESLRERPGLHIAVSLLQASGRWLLSLGRPGDEPLLRSDPHGAGTRT